MVDLLITNVYIDTCVFEYRQFDFQSPAFLGLLDLVRAGHVKILTSAITIGEFKARIEAHVSSAVTQQRKFATEGWILKRLPYYAALFKKPNKNSLSKQLIENFQNFLIISEAEAIDLDGASLDDVVTKYFLESPPFGPGDKKSEFPDALVVSALEAWSEANGEPVYLISRDQKVREACTGGLKLHALEDIRDFLDVANTYECVASDRLKSIFSLRVDSLNDGIESHFGDLGFSVWGYDGDVEIESVDEIAVGDPEVVRIEEQQATIEVECDVSFTANVSYKDPDTGMWDSEDKRMLFMDTVSKTVHHTATVSVEILFQYESRAALTKPEQVKLYVRSVSAGRVIRISV